MNCVPVSFSLPTENHLSYKTEIDFENKTSQTTGQYFNILFFCSCFCFSKYVQYKAIFVCKVNFDNILFVSYCLTYNCVFHEKCRIGLQNNTTLLPDWIVFFIQNLFNFIQNCNDGTRKIAIAWSDFFVLFLLWIK